MKADRHLGGAVPLALACLALSATSATVAANQSGEPQHVSIEASKTIAMGHAQTGIQDEVAQLSQRVAYGDLDLATAAGAHKLTSRIQSAATTVCAQLGALYPAESRALEAFERASCVSDAVGGAMVHAKMAIASATEGKLR